MTIQTKRLVGRDGKLVRVDLGEEAVGTAIDSEGDTGWYLIVEKAEESSGIPEELHEGDLYWVDGTDNNLVADDKLKPLDETALCDVEEFSFEISQNEIDVTTLCDDTRRYRGGTKDMSGQLQGIFTLGETDQSGGMANKFMRVVQQDDDGTVEVHEVDGAPVWLKGLLQKPINGAKTEAFIWMQVILLGFSGGATGDDKQQFTSNFRISSQSGEPTLYERNLPEEAA